MRVLSKYLVLCMMCVPRAMLGVHRPQPSRPQCAAPPADDARCPPSAGAHVGCCATEPSLSDHLFFIDGHQFGIKSLPDEGITLRCSLNMSLDSDALPRFPRVQRVSRVAVVDCMPPARSYARVLATLRVELLPQTPRLVLTLPTGAILRSHHLAGLPPLYSFKLSADVGAAVEPGALAAPPVGRLMALSVWNVPLRPADLQGFPPRLRALYLTSTGGDAGVTLTLPPSLKVLSVRNERLVTVNLTDTKNLESLIISRWNESHPNRWLGSKCPQLHSLVIEESLVQQLPARWVSACGSLQKLHLRAGRLRELPARLLAGARCLRSLTLTHCSLRRLPADLLADTPDLLELILSNNKLQTLPRNFFEKSMSLRKVDLSGNQLVSWSSLAASGLTSLAALDTLHLEDNPLPDDPLYTCRRTSHNLLT